MMRGMEPVGSRVVTAPAVVAQRLCDLLLSFPSAAIGGVQWHTLARKYEERFASRLELSQLGMSSPLAAATALLWDVLRLVDSEDTDNPVVAVEDAVALVPRSGSLGTWPSLYQTLCAIVLSNGTPEEPTVADGPDGASRPAAHALLLSQLKPLLQSHWHANFDENGLGYLSDEGTFVRLKKMKHLVQAVLRWRDQRVAWRAAGAAKATEVDEAVRPTLQLLASTKHNDLVLRLVHSDSGCQEVSAPSLPCWEAAAPPRGVRSHVAALERRSCVEEELAKLRAENAELRSRNELLQQHREFVPTPLKSAVPQLSQEIFDDPFEPPPEIGWERSFWGSPACSTAVPSELGYQSGSATPASGIMAAGFELSAAAWHCGGSCGHSGSVTPGSSSLGSSFEASSMSGPPTPIPATAMPGGHYDYASAPATPGKVCAYVPVWFSGNFALMSSALLGDRGVIPSGIVQQARAFFEAAPTGSAVPGQRL